MEKIKNTLRHPFVKSLILGVLTLVIGGICSAMGTWDFTHDPTAEFKLILLCICGILYIATLAFYSTYDFNIKKVSRLYENQNKIFEEIMSGIMSTCKDSANSTNKLIHSIIQKGTIDLQIWNFNESCKQVCENVYNVACKLSSGRDIEVTYIRLEEQGKEKDKIYMNAFSNKDKKPPAVYMQYRNVEEGGYHDAELFLKKEPDYEVLIGEEIHTNFLFRTKESRNKNINKYSQYISIPVFCDDKKMIGLLQIACINKTKFNIDNENISEKEGIEELVSRYFVPYTFLLLLLHKLERVLIAQPAISTNQP